MEPSWRLPVPKHDRTSSPRKRRQWCLQIHLDSSRWMWPSRGLVQEHHRRRQYSPRLCPAFESRWLLRVQLWICPEGANEREAVHGPWLCSWVEARPLLHQVISCALRQSLEAIRNLLKSVRNLWIAQWIQILWEAWSRDARIGESLLQHLPEIWRYRTLIQSLDSQSSDLHRYHVLGLLPHVRHHALAYQRHHQ